MRPAEIICARGCEFAYERTPVLRGVNFSLAEREFVFLTGKSGSGKTTILRSLYAELAPISGELSVLGKHPQSLRGRALLEFRRKIGIVFQDYKLINELSIEQNIALPLAIAGFSASRVQRQTEVVLGHIKLAHKAKKRPLELSGGEQQRVALGRAIIHNPRLIICDEPTGNLDSQSAEIVYQLLVAANISFGATVLVATHHVPAISLPHRVLRIDSGVLDA